MRVILLLLMVVLQQQAHAQEPTVARKPWIPNMATAQFAGNIGMLSVGGGYSLLRHRLQTSLLFGYLPRHYGTRSDVFTLKANYAPVRFRIDHKRTLYPYLGLTFSYETGHNTFTTLPERFPENYYFTNAFYFTFYGGLRLQRSLGPRLQLAPYIESGIVDNTAWYLLSQRRTRRQANEMFSMALGVSVIWR